MRKFLTGLGCALLLHPLALWAQGEGPGRVAVISDINGRYGTTEYNRRVSRAITRIIALEPDLVISTGDMVAGQRPDPPLTAAELDVMWRSFETTVHTPLDRAGIPLLMTPGNHDASAYPGFELERATYREYLSRRPLKLAQKPVGNYPFHYRVDIGGLRLISLDATRYGSLDPTQRDWLSGELQRTGEFTHTLVFGHLPLQPVARGREREVLVDPALESMLAEAGVTAYLSGHHHSYYPGYRLGLNMLSIGNLGGNQRELVGTRQRTGYSFAILELLPAGGLEVTALQGPSFDGPIDIRGLPASIGSGVQTLRRRDLATGARHPATP